MFSRYSTLHLGPTLQEVDLYQAAAMAVNEPEATGTIDPRVVFGTGSNNADSDDQSTDVEPYDVDPDDVNPDDIELDDIADRVSGVRPPQRRSSRFAGKARPDYAELADEDVDEGDDGGDTRKPLSQTQRSKTPSPKKRITKKASKTRLGTGTKVKENVLSRPKRGKLAQWHCDVCDMDVVGEERTRSRHERTKHHRSKLLQQGVSLPTIGVLRCTVCRKEFESNRMDSVTRHMRTKHRR